MEHITKCLMISVPRKKSYFLSQDVTYVTKLVKQAIFTPRVWSLIKVIELKEFI